LETTLDCVPCLVGQAVDAVRMATDQPDEQYRVIRRVLSLLERMNFNETPPHMAAEIHRIVKDELGVEDPYREVKEQSTELAQRIVAKFEHVVAEATDPFETTLKLAIAGNVIDFGVGVDIDTIETTVEEALGLPLPYHEVEALRSAIEQAEDILYLGDNAGEVAFDRLLIQLLPTEKVTFVVRGGPIINDATRADAEAVGLHNLVEIVDSGCVAPGTILEHCSSSFRERFRSADLIIAKGQGNYESLSAETAPIFFLLMAKCPVLAQQLGCRIGEILVCRPTGGAEHN